MKKTMTKPLSIKERVQPIITELVLRAYREEESVTTVSEKLVTLVEHRDQLVREEDRERIVESLSEKKHHGSIKWKYVKQLTTHRDK